MVADGILPGPFGYEAGQASVGDIFLWFVRTAVPGRYEERDVFERLGEEAAGIAPGTSGLLWRRIVVRLVLPYSYMRCETT